MPLYIVIVVDLAARDEQAAGQAVSSVPRWGLLAMNFRCVCMYMFVRTAGRTVNPGINPKYKIKNCY